jgi:hypothetical protein
MLEKLISKEKVMSLPASGWKNKKRTSDRDCNCGSWKNHWINFSNQDWPASCSVSGCNSKATLGAHILHSNVNGERIAPMCDSCNMTSGNFSFKDGTSLSHANASAECG